MDKTHQINNKFLKDKDKIKEEITIKTLKHVDNLHIYNNKIYVTYDQTTIIHNKTKNKMYICEYVVENNEVKLIPNTNLFYKNTLFQDNCQEEFTELDNLYQAYKKSLGKQIKKQYKK